MVLNIFPRREQPIAAPAIEPEPALPEPSEDALDEQKRKTRRGTRGGRGRRKPAGEGTEHGEGVEPETPIAEEPAPETPAPRRGRGRTTRAAAETAPAPAEAPPAPEDAEPPAARTPRPRRPRAAAVDAASPPAGEVTGDVAALTAALNAQAQQIAQLIRVQEDLVRRVGSGAPTAGPAGASVARVGVFVDAANIELACDRLRARVNWRKLLDHLTEGRQLVRAIAYSPVHDDPNVSLETQRFAEPFVDRGFRVVTKPLKRFADGTIKANVDIEMALDIVEMLDRLDVVCLVSGDGDFQRLVEVVQAKGVRVEVVSVGPSTASSLRNAADRFIDIQSILPRVKA